MNRVPNIYKRILVAGAENYPAYKFINPISNILDAYHKKQEGKILRKYGLYYEDALVDANDPLLDVAISLLPRDVQQDRLRRIQRANYVKQNHDYVDEPLQQYDPYNSYGLLDIYILLRFKKAADTTYI